MGNRTLLEGCEAARESQPRCTSTIYNNNSQRHLQNCVRRDIEYSEKYIIDASVQLSQDVSNHVLVSRITVS